MDIIITNNNTVAEAYADRYQIVFVSGKTADVFVKVRDYVHNGHKLLSHPLAGSVKPNENPYKSVLVCGNCGSVDVNSLNLIENSILAAKSFVTLTQALTDKIDNDFKLVDYTLITNALK